tara:strand:- start:423 stop:773 length:351 start_codon:yes stop_codon:yes gene_type:complete
MDYMNDEIKESWEHRIRSMAPKIKEAEESLAKADASVKKLLAELKIKAFAAGAKTSSAQETQAESSDELFKKRLSVGTAKGEISSLKVELKSLEVGFEEWRTKMVNAREERKRYGA